LTENYYNVNNRIDALSTLREWIEQEGVSFGSLKPSLVIQDNVVTDVYIHRGDETIHLRKDTKLFKRQREEIKNNLKSHF